MWEHTFKVFKVSHIQLTTSVFTHSLSSSCLMMTCMAVVAVTWHPAVACCSSFLISPGPNLFTRAEDLQVTKSNNDNDKYLSHTMKTKIHTLGQIIFLPRQNFSGTSPDYLHRLERRSQKKRCKVASYYTMHRLKRACLCVYHIASCWNSQEYYSVIDSIVKYSIV